MGAPSLKIKKELHYHKGTKTRNCGRCASYTKASVYSGGILVGDHRCKVFGIRSGRAYRIHPDYVCDRFAGIV